MYGTTAKIIVATVLAWIVLAGHLGAEERLLIGGSRIGASAMEALMAVCPHATEPYSWETHGDGPGADLYFSDVYFAAKGRRFDAVAYTYPLDLVHENRRPVLREENFETVPLGRFAVQVVVHRDNGIKQISPNQLRRLWSGAVGSWEELGSTQPGKPKLVGNLPQQTSAGILMWALVMKLGDFDGQLECYEDSYHVQTRVERDPGAIGFCLAIPGEVNLPYVRALPVVGEDAANSPSAKQRRAAIRRMLAGEDADPRPPLRLWNDEDDENDGIPTLPDGTPYTVFPSDEACRDGRYPLACNLKVLALPKPRAEVWRFLDWLESDEALDVRRKSGLFMPEQDAREPSVRRVVKDAVTDGSSVQAELRDIVASNRLALQLGGSWKSWSGHWYEIRNRTRNYVFEELASGKARLGFVLGDPTPRELAILKTAEKTAEPVVSEIGVMIAELIVNDRGIARPLDLDEITAVLTGKVTNWSELGGVDQFIQVAVSKDDVVAGQYVVRRCLFPRGEFSSGCIELENSAKLYEFVSSTPGAIGCRLFRPEREGRSENGVRTVRIVRDGGQPVGPTVGAIASGEYRLQSPLVAIARRDDDIARQFVRFLRSENAGEVIIRQGVLPYHTLATEESQQRLLAAKKGEGPQLRMVGPRAGVGVVRALTEEYVKSHEVVQVPYVARTQTLAVRDFTTRAVDWKEGEKYRRGADIILLDDTIQREARLAHGISWLKSIHPAETWELGRIGVAVVTHKSNPVDWLSMEELRDIYANRLRDWERLERGNNPDAAPLGAMKRYGLKAGQPVFLVFAEKTLGGRPMAQTIQRETTEEVIASVALDPAAIGFVSLTDLKPEENRVKILGITPQDGLFPETIGPEGPTEKYPLQQRWTLYLGPYAYRTPETKRFAEFITSNESAVAEIMRKHGLIASSTITADPLKGVTTKSDMEKPVFVVPE